MSLTLALLILAQAAAPAPSAANRARAERVLTRAPVIDGHNDLAWEIRQKHASRVEAIDLTRDTTRLASPLQTDIPRLKKGRVGGQFWSVYIPAGDTGPKAVEMTIEQIDIVRRFVDANPRTLGMARTAADVRRVMGEGRVASLLGIEGGHQIDGRLSVLRRFRDLGVGYMTITHGKSLAWADSSTDAPRARGLTPFGRQVIAEMNRIGMIADVSHVSDLTLGAVLDTTKAPVIASHSSARALADRPRNIPDDLLRRIGANGGVVMVNFYPAFLSSAWNAWENARSAFAKAQGITETGYGAATPARLREWERTNPQPRVDSGTVADHIDHIAKVAGYDSVGIGADLDGIGGSGPIGLDGVDGYPLLFAELVRRGWSDANLAKLSSGNILRVIARADAVAASMAAMPPIDATDPG